MPPRYDEDTLVQQTTADDLRDILGWDVVYVYNEETFGPEGTLGRRSDREVVLTRDLGEKLLEFNPGLPEDAYREALRQIVDWSAVRSPLALNQEKYALSRDGVLVSFRNARGELPRRSPHHQHHVPQPPAGPGREGHHADHTQASQRR